ncbi:MAG TPA: PIG-L deacetylase family protein [Streptosporangiaceae bacterium]|nr:PIG-L deacetylase family protein [Streptosporangiaceae bacterium]
MSDRGPQDPRSGRAGAMLPAWPGALVVIAHPDDESFGLGAVIDRLAAAGAAVHVLCYTHGGASTVNQTHADLHRARGTELRRAAAELGAAGVTLLDYPDGGLAGIPAAELAGHVADAAIHVDASGLLVFDDTGVTGHPDHRAATGAAVLAGRRAGLPVLAWTLPAAVAARLSAGTGQDFTGQPPDRIDLCVRVSRERQRRAALLHASQISPGAVLWRRLRLLGDCEYLRWLVPPAAITSSSAR